MSRVAAEEVWIEHRYTMRRVFEEEVAEQFGVDVYKMINEDRRGIEDSDTSTASCHPRQLGSSTSQCNDIETEHLINSMIGDDEGRCGVVP